MSKEIEIVRKIRSYQKGMPLPRRQKKSIATLPAERTFFLSFVRMGGESLPWGIIWGQLGKKPSFSIVADPWDRDSLAETLKHFEKEFSKLIEHPCNGGVEVNEPFQIYLPNSSHIEILQNLSLRYMFAKRGEELHRESLNRLGRISNFLFQEYQRPGQQTVHLMTEVLKEHYTFPADNLRMGHLGFLLALLKTEGDLRKRLNVANVAEKRTIGISLSPELEKEKLSELIDELRALRKKKTKEEFKIKNIEFNIKKIIEGELENRFKTLEEAYLYYKNDKREINSGAIVLLNDSIKSINDYFKEEIKVYEGNEERAYFSSPKTDKDDISAAINYNKYIYNEEKSNYCLALDDETIQDELISSGDALYAKIIDKQVLEKKSEKNRKIKEIFWILECSNAFPMRLREGGKVTPLFNTKFTGEIVKIELKDDKKLITLEMDPKKLSETAEVVGLSSVFLQPEPSEGFLIKKIQMYISQKRKAS